MAEFSNRTPNNAGADTSPVGEAAQFVSAGFDFAFEPADGIGRVKLYGFFDIETANDYFAKLEAFLKKVRSATGQAAILIDSTESGVQGRHVMERLQEGNLRVLMEGDRVAMVVSSTLLKMQIDRLPINSERRVFLSLDEAAAWLRNDHRDSA